MSLHTSLPPAELFEPPKHDPMNQKQRAAQEEAFLQYKNIACSNPFGAKPSYRDGLMEREARRPSAPKLDLNSNLQYQKVFIVDHPALRDEASRQDLDRHAGANEAVFGRLNTPSDPTTLHRRANSTPSPTLASGALRAPSRSIHPFTKSASDSNVLRPKVSTFSISRDGSPDRKRKVTPTPLSGFFSSPSKQALETIDEQDMLAQNYKVEAKYPGSEIKVVRSPLKKLFGEGGILGKNASAKDLTDSGSRKSGIAHWSNKFKARVDDMTTTLAERLAALETNLQQPSNDRHTQSGPSTFPVSLSPYVQGDFYMQLELLLNISINNFLQSEFKLSRLTHTSIKEISTKWSAKGRPQVLGFRYDLGTQRDLVGLNISTLHFSGINAFSSVRLLGVLAGWKVLAREVGVRTFCQPDSAVKKHLFDAEKVLEIVGASEDSMMAFQELRGRVVSEIWKEERRERERREWNGVERAWSPSKKFAMRF